MWNPDSISPANHWQLSEGDARKIAGKISLSKMLHLLQEVNDNVTVHQIGLFVTLIRETSFLLNRENLTAIMDGYIHSHPTAYQRIASTLHFAGSFCKIQWMCVSSERVFEGR